MEHPEHSHAFDHFGLPKPTAKVAGWTAPDEFGGRSCRVEQGWYGHVARKVTWLYAILPTYPALKWDIGTQRLDQKLVKQYGYAYARRKGIVSMIGGKDKTKIRNATPMAFRDVLLGLARSCSAPSAK